MAKESHSPYDSQEVEGAQGQDNILPGHLQGATSHQHIEPQTPHQCINLLVSVVCHNLVIIFQKPNLSTHETLGDIFHLNYNSDLVNFTSIGSV